MSDFETALATTMQLWPVLVTVVIIVAWFIRLESRQLFHEKDFERYRNQARENEKKIWENIDKIKEQNTEILQSLSRLEGKIDRL